MPIIHAVKRSLMIPLEEDYADSELNYYIASCKELLISSGIPEEVVEREGDSLVDSLVLIYCKTFFGFKNDGSVKDLPKSFDMLLKQLVLTKGNIPHVS